MKCRNAAHILIFNGIIMKLLCMYLCQMDFKRHLFCTIWKSRQFADSWYARQNPARALLTKIRCSVVQSNGVYEAFKVVIPKDLFCSAQLNGSFVAVYCILVADTTFANFTTNQTKFDAHKARHYSSQLSYLQLQVLTGESLPRATVFSRWRKPSPLEVHSGYC